MKRTMILLLAALLVTALFSGCNLQNRKPSSDFIPETVPTEPTEPPETEPTEESTAPTTAVMEATVRDLVEQDGKYTDRYGHNYTYKYHVPFIDAEAKYAQECNKDIDRRFGAVVTSQLNAMEDGSTLTLLSVDYMTRLRGNFLTLYVTSKSIDGEEIKAVYTFERFTGAEVTGAQILAELGLEEERFLELAEDVISAYFDETYGEYAWNDQMRYNTAKDRTLRGENISIEMPMYLDESDRLTILATVFDIAGEAHLEPLLIEWQPSAEEAP